MAAGPVLAVGVCEALGWTWVYGIAALVACSSALLCVAMQESRPSKLLSERVELVAQQSGYKHLTTDTEDSLPTLKEFFRKSLWQPIRLCAEPIIVVVSIMAATVVAVVYLFSEVLGEVYITGFGFSERDYSLVFIAIGLGAIFSLLPRFYDVHVAKKRERNNEILEPEDKLFGFYLAAPVLACGLWWFAWTVPPLVNIGSWPSVLALLLIGYGVVEFDSALSGYLTDAYASYAASASAPMSTLRATLSGVFPLFGRKFFVAVGNNYALSILASFATCFCGIAVLFRMYGRRIREKSPFAISNRESALPMRKFT
ncbi:MFS general substrate transporter [Piedraia hortae CBS 480.64]|uniref:MFS general substrate transporter n=1 Tax=Piedraia hortae CBS 480.64 TaxID=1314780 RepID=A0A6A7C493_9PEZI|nr:MFS general substrate transporter [Piedraia hortae CBS 480.64]